jgi:uncharacterized protein
VVSLIINSYQRNLGRLRHFLPGEKFMPATEAVSNADVVRKAFAAFNAGDAATLNELIAEDAVWHNPGQGPLCGVHEGREAIFAVFGQVAELCPNYQAQLVDLLANDERVVAIVRATGSRPGKTADSEFVDVFRVRDGKITGWRSYPEDQRAEDEFWS